MVGFGGDTNQPGQFVRSVPDFVLKGGYADVVRLLVADHGTVGSAWSEAITGGSMILSCH